jgi:cell division protein FtsQ
LQSLETGPEIWRRASPSPTPRPVLTKTQATILPSSRPRRRAALLTRPTLLIGAALVSFATSAHLHSATAAYAAGIERLLEHLGFGLRQASVTGYRYTADSAVFDALRLEHARTLLFFDSRAAQRRIEALPWVATASIARILPDRIEVRITERTPIAIWQRAEKSFLIDATGRVLSPVAADTTAQLPRVAGEGAAVAAAELLTLLGAYPSLAQQLAVAERVGERRWTLWLSDGGGILLPAEGAEDALARAVAIANRLPGRPLGIDVRTSRTLISVTPRPQVGNANSPAATEPGVRGAAQRTAGGDT